MTDLERRQVRTRAMSDQAWAGIEARHEDVQRISEHGPRPTIDDMLLVEMMIALVAGEMHRRAADAIMVDLDGVTQ